MIHVDENADDHVMDQNVDRISREMSTYLLVGGSGPKVVHACLEDDGSWLMFSED